MSRFVIRVGDYDNKDEESNNFSSYEDEQVRKLLN